MTRIWLALVALPLFFGCVKDDKKDQGESLVTVGQTIPEFTVTGNQKTFDSSSLDARITLLTFFHSGCPDCERILPHLLYVYERYEADTRFEMVNIGREQTLGSIPSAWLTMPCYPDPDRGIYNQFATATIPRVYIVDANGEVLQMWVEELRDAQGKELSESEFAAIIEAYLRMR